MATAHPVTGAALINTIVHLDRTVRYFADGSVTVDYSVGSAGTWEDRAAALLADIRAGK